VHKSLVKEHRLFHLVFLATVTVQYRTKSSQCYQSWCSLPWKPQRSFLLQGNTLNHTLTSFLPVQTNYDLFTSFIHGTLSVFAFTISTTRTFGRQFAPYD